MKTDKELLAVAISRPDLATPDEVASAMGIISATKGLGKGERENLCAAFERGPLFYGDVPSPKHKLGLMRREFLCAVIARGELGYYACTPKGAIAYRLMKAGA